jgi:hypothetical protein
MLWSSFKTETCSRRPEITEEIKIVGMMDPPRIGLPEVYLEGKVITTRVEDTPDQNLILLNAKVARNLK